MKKINLTKKDIGLAAGLAVVGAGVGVAVSKLTTKKEEVAADEAYEGDSCTDLDEAAAGIDAEEGSQPDAFVPGAPVEPDEEKSFQV
jgi:hypothetical protein